MNNSHVKIGIIGLGYVGLPLAALLSEQYSVLGFDLDSERVTGIINGKDPNLEVTTQELKTVLKQEKNTAKGLFCTTKAAHLSACNFFIVCVPTPVDIKNEPDFSMLKAASKTVGKAMQKGSYVVFESTVYPGATEDICKPILEKESHLIYNTDFFLGYSPERINPGDQSRKLKDIVKITSGSTPEAAQYINNLYNSVINAGTYLAPSIQVAEAAKVIENAQRDLNIAFVNELAMIFGKMGLDTTEVLKAAATKWNFMPFTPGLVGGHCIGVDPYYLAAKAKQIGHHPEVILAGRKLNNQMGAFVAGQLLHLMGLKKQSAVAAPILLVGFSFKENCPDVRNTGVMTVYKALEAYGAQLNVYDPVADADAAHKNYGVTLIDEPKIQTYSAIVLCVPHYALKEIDWRVYLTDKGVLYKVKQDFSCPAHGNL